MSPQTPLDPEDQIKIESWFYVMNLLEHYRALTFEPMYQHAAKLLAPRRLKESRLRKIEIIVRRHNELVSKWENALGPNWRDYLEQD
jgi:hypothetical protein